MANLVDKILNSKKYRSLYRPTVERIVNDIASRYPAKLVEKAVKRRLHQIWGAYLIRPDFKKLLTDIEKRLGKGESIKSILLPVLALQSSTKERIPILDEFYQKIFSLTGKPESIVEPGCGLNSLTYFWLPSPIKYFGFDVDMGQIDFLNSVLALAKTKNAKVCLGDVFVDSFKVAEMVLLLKVLPLFEHQVKGCSLSILKKMECKYLVVSFPTKSLSGKNKGMKEYYEQQFKDLIKSEHWSVKKLEFESELVFVIKKSML